jgi:hypothetical protein
MSVALAGVRGSRVVVGLLAVALATAALSRTVLGQSPQSYVLIVTGASGEPRFAAAFHGQAMALRAAALNRFAIPDSAIVYLAEDVAKAPAAIRERSTREGVKKAIDGIAGRAKPGDRVLILLIGHGSTQSEEPRFSLPGPDLSAADFAALLDKLRSQTVAFVNASSASGDFIKALAAPNRIVVTATKSSHEGNETLFAQHFVAAYAAEGADVDKDGRVSLLEAFEYARREVQREYEKTNRLQTEHAMLDDDGDGVGHGDASEKGPDGLRARGFHLGMAGGTVASLANDPRAAELLATQAKVQAQVDSLRALRAGMKEEDFQRLLEPLLVKLAETTQALRALQVKKP